MIPFDDLPEHLRNLVILMKAMKARGTPIPPVPPSLQHLKAYLVDDNVPTPTNERAMEVADKVLSDATGVMKKMTVPLGTLVEAAHQMEGARRATSEGHGFMTSPHTGEVATEWELARLAEAQRMMIAVMKGNEV